MVVPPLPPGPPPLPPLLSRPRTRPRAHAHKTAPYLVGISDDIYYEPASPVLTDILPLPPSPTESLLSLTTEMPIDW